MDSWQLMESGYELARKKPQYIAYIKKQNSLNLIS